MLRYSTENRLQALLEGLEYLLEVAGVQKGIVLISGAERKTKCDRGKRRQRRECGWLLGLPLSENGVLQPAHALGKKRRQIVVKDANVLIGHLFELIGCPHGYALLRHALCVGSPIAACCRVRIGRAVAYLPLKVPGGCPFLAVENLGIHIVHKYLGVGLAVDFKLLDGLDGNPETDLSPDNGGRVFVKVGDFHPSRLIKEQKQGGAALPFAFVINRAPVMNDGLGNEAYHGRERFQIALRYPKIHGDGS